MVKTNDLANLQFPIPHLDQVSDQHVVTAAHCFPAAEPGTGERLITHARLGDADLTSDADGRGIDVQVCEVVEKKLPLPYKLNT